jgi:hypothetical protein
LSEAGREVPRVVGGRPHADDVRPAPGEIAGACSAWGSRRALLRIGSLALELAGLDEALEALVRRNYAGFLAEPGAPASVVQLLRTPRERFLYLPRAEGRSEEARLDARSGDDGLELWSYFFAGSFDREAERGRLLLCEAEQPDREQAIENYLRFFVSTAALRRGGFLLHSSGVVRNGRAVLFFGPSGAGKSTAAANSPGCERLGDDLVLVEPDGAAYRACGVPFRGSFVGDERNSSTCASLAMACRLVQAARPRVEATSRPVQAAELVAQLPFLLDDAALRERAVRCVGDFVAAVPVRRLHLRADAGFWEVLDPIVSAG